jgi:hypothetical protein
MLQSQSAAQIPPKLAPVIPRNPRPQSAAQIPQKLAFVIPNGVFGERNLSFHTSSLTKWFQFLSSEASFNDQLLTLIESEGACPERQEGRNLSFRNQRKSMRSFKRSSRTSSKIEVESAW